METSPGFIGVKSRISRVAVSKRRSELTGESYFFRATKAVAIAEIPLPSPVNPNPSVDVAVTETGAPPSAFDNALIASARRGPIFGLLQIIWTATLLIA
jgi:hypothetical protein